ncbi:transposase [Moorena sp. SIO1G6]|uniref:transposase n=1 Tax=Moorena sp. SIO1G6 TaxID=2607840 RepID=UPI0009F70233
MTSLLSWLHDRTCVLVVSSRLRSFSHSVGSIEIHIVFVTKSRYPVRSGDVELDIIDLIHGICQKHRCLLKEAKGDLVKNDQIHLLIDLAPDVLISTKIREITI